MITFLAILGVLFIFSMPFEELIGLICLILFLICGFYVVKYVGLFLLIGIMQLF